MCKGVYAYVRVFVCVEERVVTIIRHHRRIDAVAFDFFITICECVVTSFCLQKTVHIFCLVLWGAKANSSQT